MHSPRPFVVQRAGYSASSHFADLGRAVQAAHESAHLRSSRQTRVLCAGIMGALVVNTDGKIRIDTHRADSAKRWGELLDAAGLTSELTP